MTIANEHFNYRYQFSSCLLGKKDAGVELTLSTCTRQNEYPFLFSGQVSDSRLFGDLLLTLSQVVGSHFYQPNSSLRDPVVTCSQNYVRLEGFSGCGGVYVRIDLGKNFFLDAEVAPGTTNVDFNDPMRSALGQLGQSREVNFNVGKEAVELISDKESFVEKKVKLPSRWIKGFSEVQLLLPRLIPRSEVRSIDALRFIRQLPNANSPKKKVWVQPSGNGLRLTGRATRGNVGFFGTQRIKCFERLLKHPGRFRIYDDVQTGISGWEYRGSSGNLLLVLSPKIYRGFSGEGGLLETLGDNAAHDLVDVAFDKIKSNELVRVNALSDTLNCSASDLKMAFELLGSKGLAGYDLEKEAYFFRELPFGENDFQNNQPRYKAALRLVASGEIQLVSHRTLGKRGDAFEVKVPGSGVDHLVRMTGNKVKCSCPWYSRYQGERGVCKHILASKMFVQKKLQT